MFLNIPSTGLKITPEGFTNTCSLLYNIGNKTSPLYPALYIAPVSATNFTGGLLPPPDFLPVPPKTSHPPLSKRSVIGDVKLCGSYSRVYELYELYVPIALP